MWKQPHFIHRSGNLTDKHLDCVWIWSLAAIVRTQAPVSRPLLAKRLHPVHPPRPPRTPRPPRPPRTPRRSFALCLKVSKFLGKQSSIVGLVKKMA